MVFVQLLSEGVGTIIRSNCSVRPLLQRLESSLWTYLHILMKTIMYSKQRPGRTVNRSHRVIIPPPPHPSYRLSHVLICPGKAINSSLVERFRFLLRLRPGDCPRTFRAEFSLLVFADLGVVKVLSRFTQCKMVQLPSLTDQCSTLV